MRINKWIEGLHAGETFFKYIGNLGWMFLIIFFFVSSLSFWFFLVIFHNSDSVVNLAALMFLVARLGVIFLLGGIIFQWLLYSISIILERKRDRVIIEREVLKSIYNNNIKKKDGKKK